MTGSGTQPSTSAKSQHAPRTDTMVIRGTAVPVTYEDVDQNRLRFYEANPRIYSFIRKGGKTPTQADILERLLDMEHVKELIQDIRRNGGLMEPILVRRGTYEVLEGNSRLAAYRALAVKDPLKWAKIRCILLPESLQDNLTFALLAQLHVKGKKDWAPFEQAGFLYRRFHEQHIDLPTLSAETGLSQKRVKALMDTYEFMTDSGETDITHWSHYEEFLKNRSIQKACDKYPSFTDTVVGLIQKDSSFKAVDVRDRLPKICAAPAKTLKRFADGSLPFEKAFDAAIDAGVDNNAYRKLNRFRQWIADADAVKAMVDADTSEADKIVYELDKIKNRVVQVQKIMEKRARR